MIAPFLDVYRVDIKGFSERTYLRMCHMKSSKIRLKRADVQYATLKYQEDSNLHFKPEF